MESNTETIEGGSADETNDVEVAEEQQASGNWYVVQTLSGQEMKAQESIERRRTLEEVDDVVFKALVPMEPVTEIKQGKKTTVNKKIYPGYILINMTLYDEQRNIHERVWNFINDTQ